MKSVVLMIALSSCVKPIVHQKKHKCWGYDRIGNELVYHPDSFFIRVGFDWIAVDEKKYLAISIGDTIFVSPIR